MTSLFIVITGSFVMFIIILSISDIHLEHHHKTMHRLAEFGAIEVEDLLISPLFNHYDFNAPIQKISPEKAESLLCNDDAELDDYYRMVLFGGARSRYDAPWNTLLFRRMIDDTNKHYRSSDGYVRYGQVITIIGYVPVHGVANKKCIGPPLGTTPKDELYHKYLKSDRINCRNQRLYPEAAYVAHSVTPTEPYLYEDPFTGESYFINGAEIKYKGETWGYYIIAYDKLEPSLDYINPRNILLKVIVFMLFIGGVFDVILKISIKRYLGIKK